MLRGSAPKLLQKRTPSPCTWHSTSPSKTSVIAAGAAAGNANAAATANSAQIPDPGNRPRISSADNR